MAPSLDAIAFLADESLGTGGGMAAIRTGRVGRSRARLRLFRPMGHPRGGDAAYAATGSLRDETELNESGEAPADAGASLASP